MATSTRARVPKYPAFTEKEVKALQEIHVTEQRSQPTKIEAPMLAVLGARGAIYTVEFHDPRRTFAHLTARGCAVIDVAVGNRA